MSYKPRMFGYVFKLYYRYRKNLNQDGGCMDKPKMLVLDMKPFDNKVLVAEMLPMIGKCNGCSHVGDEDVPIYKIIASSEPNDNAIADGQAQPLHICYDCLTDGMTLDNIYWMYN